MYFAHQVPANGFSLLGPDLLSATEPVWIFKRGGMWPPARSVVFVLAGAAALRPSAPSASNTSCQRPHSYLSRLIGEWRRPWPWVWLRRLRAQRASGGRDGERRAAERKANGRLGVASGRGSGARTRGLRTRPKARGHALRAADNRLLHAEQCFHPNGWRMLLAQVRAVCDAAGGAGGRRARRSPRCGRSAAAPRALR